MIKNKIVFLFVVLASVAYTATAQTIRLGGEQSFRKACMAVVAAFAKNDIAAINKNYIHPEYGVYTIYRPGAIDRFVQSDTLDVTAPLPHGQTHSSKAKPGQYPLRYRRLPRFDCDKEAWDKTGLYADTIRHPKPLTHIALFEEKYEERIYNKKEKARLRFIENNSFCIIFTETEAGGLVFYMMRIKGRWYLSVIDMAMGDCSA
jgi:hypothetical protein